MPKTNLPPHNVQGMAKFADAYEVASWSPGTVAQQIPPTQVHLVIRPMGDGTLPAVVLRFKSRRAVQELIDTLQEHMEYTFSSEGDI